MKKFLLFVALAFATLIGIVVFNTLRFTPVITKVDPLPKIEISDESIDNMAEAISIRTVSFEDEADFDSIQFQKFNEFIAVQYPLLNEQADHKIFSGFSHLFKLEGSKPSKLPIILMGHHDVVPIASPSLWSVHPFTEGVKNDTIYGRGCIDDKAGVVGILESIEQLLREGFQPERTIYFAFGHDEEVSGGKGAVEIVKYLKANNITAEFILDEGGAITQGLVPGVSGKTALIGVAEKGYVTYELTVAMEGGHSSQPSKETSIDVLSAAISKLKKNPPPAYLTPVLEAFMDEMGPHMSFTAKMAMANRFLFKSVLLGQYQKTKQGNANVRTTTSPTIFEAGIKENVIPTAARAVVNFRIIPGETVVSVKEHIISTIGDDRITVEIKGKGFDPSVISPSDNDAFEVISTTIKQVHEGIIVSPNLVIGATDARHYVDISDNIYRFAPIQLTPATMNCFHGIDERISVEEFKDAVRFYRQIIMAGSGI